MAIQLAILERRDHADRLELANAALAACRITRNQEGIVSSRFFWHGADTIVLLTEGEDSALDAQTEAEGMKALFNLVDLARLTRNWRLIDPKVGAENYLIAGRG